MVYTFLVCSVGGAPQPVVAGILHCQPERVLFVCSKETSGQVDLTIPTEGRSPGILQLLKTHDYLLSPSQYELLELPDAQDLASASEALIREVGPRVRDWGARGTDYRVILDFTGGTKCMSAAMVLASFRWPCSWQYVGGNARTKEGTGIVVDGREEILHQNNPWDTLALGTLERVSLLFDSGDFAASVREAEDGRNRATGRVRRALAALAQFCGCYCDWDRFAHGDALRKANQFLESWVQLSQYWPTQHLDGLARTVQKHAELLAHLALGRPSMDLVGDLYANAQRRFTEGRFDDAVARLYRCVEAYAQAALASAGIASTAAVPVDQLPAELQNRWIPAPGKATVTVALQGAYDLLRALSPAEAEPFFRLGLGGPRSPLIVRNHSILAHGFVPVSREAAQGLLLAVGELLPAGIGQNLPVFPRLGWLGPSGA